MLSNVALYFRISCCIWGVREGVGIGGAGARVEISSAKTGSRPETRGEGRDGRGGATCCEFREDCGGGGAIRGIGAFALE